MAATPGRCGVPIAAANAKDRPFCSASTSKAVHHEPASRATLVGLDESVALRTARHGHSCLCRRGQLPSGHSRRSARRPSDVHHRWRLGSRLTELALPTQWSWCRRVLASEHDVRKHEPHQYPAKPAERYHRRFPADHGQHRAERDTGGDLAASIDHSARQPWTL
ncbi:hypothetical protein D3C87_1632590 [compost metagenome]